MYLNSWIQLQLLVFRQPQVPAGLLLILLYH